MSESRVALWAGLNDVFSTPQRKELTVSYEDEENERVRQRIQAENDRLEASRKEAERIAQQAEHDRRMRESWTSSAPSSA